MFPGMGGLDPRKMQGMMKQLGIQQEEIPAEKVTIEKTDGSKIIIENPKVQKIKMQGQESFQVTGEVREEAGEKFTDEDVKLVMEKTSTTEEKARATLEETEDIAEAIMKLSP
ncbi:MAG: nascent polypeptide-associated complex protein [Nanoarchaeota archaeon]|nr:nascent polypeptide-associated complex protein [Nanoarchaeota archaeon]MBU1104091.1 nascent polypeptide-associated complex protein [Nanoarchaeota archaeon]